MGSQVWTMEKLENKLVDMRDMYEERKDSNNCQRLPVKVKKRPRGQKVVSFFEKWKNLNFAVTVKFYFFQFSMLMSLKCPKTLGTRI